MAIYFVDPYKKYYDTLNSASNMTADLDSFSSKISESSTSLSQVASSITDNTWNELGVTQISSNVVPSLQANHETVQNNINNSLKAMATKATGELLPEVTKLKEEDEKYESYKNELDSLAAPTQYDKDGKTTSEYTAYINKKTDLTEKMNTSKSKCEEYIRNADSMVTAIKALDSSIEEFKVTVSTGTGTQTENTGTDTSGVTIGEAVEGGTMLKLTINGHEFYVANTRISVTDYEAYVNKVGLTQNAGFMGSECSTLSQVYACDMMRGTYTSKSTEAVSKQSPCTRVSATCESTNEDDVKQYLFNEIKAGRVCTLQATQVMTKVNGSRHVVTVVGFDSSVKSYKDLNPNTILVLDCVDGKIQTLSGYERTDGKGHNRQLYAMKNSKGQNTYMAHGASSAFLSKEVNNANWQARNGKGRNTVA